MGPIATGGRVTLAIVDTGAHRTVIDARMAELLGLQVTKEAGDVGKFAVPGSGAVNSYAGIVAGETTFQLHDKVLFKVNNLRVINHPHPFFLLGADVLRGGRPTDQWNFRSLKVDTLGVNQVRAYMEFDVKGEILVVPLPHAPAGLLNSLTSAAALGSGGQRLRRNL